MAPFTPLHEAQSQPFPDSVRLSSGSFDSTSTAGALLEDRNTMNALFLDFAIALSEACGWSAVETLMAKRLGASGVPTLASLLSLAYSAGIYTAQSSPSSTSPFIPTKSASTTEPSQSAVSAKPQPAALAASQTATPKPQPTLVTSSQKFPPATSAKYLDLARNLPSEPPAEACLFRDKDSANPNVMLAYQTISCMPQFLTWSPEELRYMHILKEFHSRVAAKSFDATANIAKVQPSAPLFGSPQAPSAAPNFSSSFTSPWTTATSAAVPSSNAATGAFQNAQPAGAALEMPARSAPLFSPPPATGTALSFLPRTSAPTTTELPSSGVAFNFSNFQDSLSRLESTTASLAKSWLSASAAEPDSADESAAIKQSTRSSLNPALSGNSTDSLTQIGSASSPSSVTPRTGA